MANPAPYLRCTGPCGREYRREGLCMTHQLCNLCHPCENAPPLFVPAALAVQVADLLHRADVAGFFGYCEDNMNDAGTACTVCTTLESFNRVVNRRAVAGDE